MPIIRLWLGLVAVQTLIAACSPFPQMIPGSEGDPGDYPALQPIDELLAQADALDSLP